MGAGSAWGDREEFLHPRDSHGRFRNTWRMPQGAADAISKFLDSFSPKMFGSDQEAQSWVHNESRKNRLGTNQGSAITNFVKGFSNVNNNLRAGKADPQAAQMLKGAEPLPNDLILTKTVDPTAFGLSPDNIANVEELTGKLIHDPGFTSANIGTPNPLTGPGPHIQMTIATPAGTKAIIPQVSSPTSEVMLTPDQNLRVTKVTPDGKGGYYMMAVATPGGTPKEKSTPLHEAPPAPAPLNLPPKPGEQPATPGTAPAVAEPPAPTATPTAPSVPAPAAPAQPGPPGTTPSAPRSEPNVVEALTPGGTPTPSAPPSAPAEAAPAGPVDFRQAVKDANIPSPTEGPRRKQWNSAYLGVVGGKKHPEDALRELRADIEHNKATLADDVKTNTDSGPLPNDIKAQEALANLIEEKFGLGKPKEAAPTTEPQKAIPARRGPKVISKEEMPNKAAIRRESRAKTPPPTSEQAKRAEEAKALGIKADEARAAENAAHDAAAKRVSDPWLEKAGVKNSDLTDHERLGVTLMANMVAQKKISRPEAARRLRQEGKPDSHLSRIADAIAARPTKAVPAKAAEAATPATPSAKGAIPEKATIAQLRQIAKDRGVKIPSKLTRKDDIRAHLEGGGTPSVSSKPSTEDRVAKLLLDKIKARDPQVADRILKDMSPADRKAVEEGIARVEGHATGLKEGAIPEKATIADLRKIAQERGVKIPSKLTRKADIRAHLEGAGKTPSGEELARTRQGHIDQARKVSDLISGLDGALDDGASKGAMRAKVEADAKRLGAPDNVRDDLLKAVDTGDHAKIRAAISRVERSNGLTPVSGARAGTVMKFNPSQHETLGEKLTTGHEVRVARPGHEAALPGGEKVQLSKAKVESHAPEVKAPAAKVESALPAHADLNKMMADLKLDPKVVKDRKAILDHVRTDLAEGKKTPAQVGRELDKSISGIESSAAIRFGGHIGNPSEERKVELRKQLEAHRHEASELRKLADKLKATRRTPGSTPAKAAPAVKAAPSAPIGISSKDVKEGDAIVWQPPGETPVLGHVVKKGRFTNIKWSSGREEPLRSNRRDPSLRKATEADIKELGGSSKATPATIEAPAELKKAYAQTTMAELRKQASDNGITVPTSARTKKDVFDHIVQEMAKRELARRGTAKATEPKAAKAAPATKTEKAAAAEAQTIKDLKVLSRGGHRNEPGPPVLSAGHKVDDHNIGRLKMLDRPKADEPIHLPNGGSDQGLMHIDSELGQLWADLYVDTREPNSFVNEIARLGDELGRGNIPLTGVIEKLKEIKKRASDEAVANRIQKAIDGVDSPEVAVPHVPNTVPASVKKFLADLAKIPTARKTGRIGATNPRVSVLNEKADLIRRIDAGEIRNSLEAERELRKRDLHESADGAFAMWKLAERLFTPTHTRLERKNGKIQEINEPNPDWPAIRDWIRARGKHNKG